ncbi:MAG: hypothetical protein K0S33_700 [Bacteroidetes bacterium]|jgi:hypothetical protein|nr:hypothetical protein [Bacteroidota bacterium]
MNFQLFPLKGFNELLFGCTPKEFIAVFGKPDETEELNDEIFNDQSVVYHYWDMGFSAFFTKKAQEVFTSIEIDAENTVLFGKQVFKMNEKELIELFKQHSFVLSESEKHDWGEKRLSFDEAGVDLYFANNKLSSINYGINTESDGFHYFPN